MSHFNTSQAINRDKFFVIQREINLGEHQIHFLSNGSFSLCDNLIDSPEHNCTAVEHIHLTWETAYLLHAQLHEAFLQRHYMPEGLTLQGDECECVQLNADEAYLLYSLLHVEFMHSTMAVEVQG
jgi:hypothetical protein